MLLSEKWLNDFVQTEIAPREYAERMSMSGSKVEGFTAQRDVIKGVVAGLVKDVGPHPNADRLSVCKIDIGGAVRTVLTAAANVTPGALVPVALDGAVLPNGTVIKAGEMRGVLSEGMLCSIKELGLSLNDVPYAAEDGILILDQNDCAAGVKPGDDICAALMLDDLTYEFEITPNRPDCLSVRGLARETAATFGKPLTLPEPSVRGGGGDIRELLKISVEDAALCPRYSAMMVKDVKIGVSPLWLRMRLRASGVRPINNMVDITNYVMLEYGQPMHAFDYACLEGREIVVRPARAGESICTLDGQERKLSPDMLMIADAKKPVCVAGVMGGLNSEITGKTDVIVLESATFNGPSVRKTALKLAMRTDASGRFEKGLDTENTVPALLRACELIEQLGAGTVLDGVIDVDASGYKPRLIPVEHDKINALLGADIPDVDKYLTSLGFEVKGGMARVPSWRADVTGMADLAEEAARLYGYNNIPSSLSSGGAAVGALTPSQKLKLQVKQACRSAGYDEMLSYSFISPSDYDRINLPEGHKLRDSAKLLNPLGEDKSVMRTVMLPSLLTMLASNAAVRNPEARLFELGLTFTPRGEKLPREETVISFGAYSADGFDFFALKGAAESVASLFFIGNLRFKRLEFPAFHPGRCAAVYAGETYVGMLGEIHPDVLETYGFNSRVCAVELSFDALFAARGGEPRYTPLPRYPGIRRDISLVCGREILSDELLDCIRAACGELLEDCRPFDVYTGEGIPEDKKSVAYKLTFRDPARTLTDDEADSQTALAVGALKEKFGAALR